MLIGPTCDSWLWDSEILSEGYRCMLGNMWEDVSLPSNPEICFVNFSLLLLYLVVFLSYVWVFFRQLSIRTFQYGSMCNTMVSIINTLILIIHSKCLPGWPWLSQWVFLVHCKSPRTPPDFNRQQSHTGAHHSLFSSSRQGKPYYFDHVFQSNTTQEQFYNAVARKIVKGEAAELRPPKTQPKPGCSNVLFLCLDLHRCSGRLQRDNICLWTDILWQNTHYGGKFMCPLLFFILKIMTRQR